MPAEPANRIQLLSEHVCNKIAAGEVIERPASVFKELVENSVDAGATAIEVEVLQGGRKAVIITDDGCGMSRESALLALERHATSKIRDVDDIEHIHTMGFRGEALAAIAAVSRFELTTRPADHLGGTRLRVEGGTLRDVEEAGCPPGTRLEVRNLFFNVPARRKFLRTEATELANIRTLFHIFAIAHPNVALRLRVDGKELEHYPAQTRLRDRIANVYGDGLLGRLREVGFQQGELMVHGFAGLPTLHRGDRRDQITLVNRRPATAPVLGYAIREAYRDSLPKKRHPVVFLHLDMPADWVDVNVHPTKREVRFGPSHRVRDALMQALTRALEGTDASETPPAGFGFDSAAAPPRLHPEHRQTDWDVSPSYPPLPPRLSPSAPAPPPTPAPSGPPPPPLPEDNTPPPSEAAGPWRHARVLGTVGRRFALLETDEGLVIMDPRAARERILFERAQDELDRNQVASQPLLVPTTLECDPVQSRTVNRHLEAFRTLGFALEPFGGDTWMVEALPAWLGDVEPADTLKTLAEELERGGGTAGTPEKRREQLARSCCRLAARSRAVPSEKELEHLVQQLGRCRMPYTTPHGRPTLIHMGFAELKRKFGLET